MAAAAVIVFATWTGVSGGPGRSFVIARADLAAGSRLGPADLATATMTLPNSSTAAVAFQDAAALDGRILAAPVRAGELIQLGDLVAAGQEPAVRPITVPVPDTDLTLIHPGQLVDVLVTDGSTPSSPTELVLAGANVLAESSDGGSGVIGSSASARITLGVSSLAEVEAIVHAAQTGTLAVVAGEPSDGSGLGPGCGCPAVPGANPPLTNPPGSGTRGSGAGAGGAASPSGT